MQIDRPLHALRPHRLGYRASTLSGVALGCVGSRVPGEKSLGAVAAKPAPVLGPQMCANPLPPGRYAITLSDSPAGSVKAFQVWAENNAVRIEASQSMSAGSSTGLVAIFATSKPVMWSPTIWGCPRVAGDSIKTLADAQPALVETPSSNPLSKLFPSLFGTGGSGMPAWVYLSLGAVVLVALAPTMFEVSKVVAIREEHKA